MFYKPDHSIVLLYLSTVLFKKQMNEVNWQTKARSIADKNQPIGQTMSRSELCLVNFVLSKSIFWSGNFFCWHLPSRSCSHPLPRSYDNIFKYGPTPASFLVYFCSFQTLIRQKNLRLQRDSNFHERCRRRAR